MKKLFLAALTAIALAACSGERDYLECQGLSLGLTPAAFIDSLEHRGMAIDTQHSTDDQVVLSRPGETNYSITVASRNGAIFAVQETYRATYNDSTRFLWQRLRDDFVEKLGRNPGVPKRNDDHKIADFDTSDYHLIVTLDNRSVPLLTVLYETKEQQ